jgi:hypothetical protein
MVSSFEDVKTKAMAEAKQELQGDASIDPSQESTPSSQQKAKGGKTVSEKRELMRILCRIPFINEIEEKECDGLADIVTVRRLERGSEVFAILAFYVSLSSRPCYVLYA